MSNVKDINVKAGQNFQIQVPFSGFPKPTAVWMNGIKEIEDDTRINLKVAEDHVLLTNTKAERGDAGRYRLTLKNPSGQDSGSLNVNVLGKLHLRNSFLLQFITVEKKNCLSLDCCNNILYRWSNIFKVLQLLDFNISVESPVPLRLQ